MATDIERHSRQAAEDRIDLAIEDMVASLKNEIRTAALEAMEDKPQSCLAIAIREVAEAVIEQRKVRR